MHESEMNFLEQERQKVLQEKSKKKRWRWYAMIVLLVVGSIWIGLSVFGQDAPEDPLLYNPVTLEPKAPEGFFNRIRQIVFTKDVILEGQEEDRINVLLLGMGGAGHDGPYLTDTIMIGSIKPSTEQIALISIPRDLSVTMPGYGEQKINHANAFGEEKKADYGGGFATEVVEKNFDLSIPYYVRVDFEAFEEIIDEIGGIKVNVERSFEDQTYPTEDNGYQTVSFARGIQTMNGDMALKYARSRHGNNGEGSDFARAKRQQKMLLALRQKLMSFETVANPVRIHNIIKSLDTHITTNMAFSDMIALVKMVRGFTSDKIISLVLDSSPQGFLTEGYSPSGAFILKPKTGNFDDVTAAMANVFQQPGEAKHDDTPRQEAPKLSPAVIEVQNGTWAAGLAARMKKRLEEKNIIVTTIGNTTERPQMLSGIYVVSSKTVADVTTALQTELHIPIRQTPGAGITYASSTDILVILGEDMQE